MRDHGKTAKELAGIFGYDEKGLIRAAALGFTPDLVKLSGCGNLTQDMAERYLLPLRVWPSDIPKNDKALDYSLYDYSEVTAVIDLLVLRFRNTSPYGDWSSALMKAPLASSVGTLT